MLKINHAVLFAVALLSACGGRSVIKETVSGGDAYPKVVVLPTGQVEESGIGVGDTVLFAPGSMRAVVASPKFDIVLIEPRSTTDSAVEKSLSVNRRDGAKIEVVRGRLFNGDFFQQSAYIDLSNSDPAQYNIDITLLAFNRGEKPFRGDLTIYDSPPPELVVQSVDAAAKYTDRTGVKGVLMALPILQLAAMAMDNFSRSSEAVEMEQSKMEGGTRRYILRKLVLEPGQAVGFVTHFRYQPPTPEELDELRMEAKPLAPKG